LKFIITQIGWFSCNLVTKIGIKEDYMATRRRLKTLEDVRRYLAGLINRAEHKEVAPNLAGKLGYLAINLAKIIEGSTLEKRVEALEKEVASKAEGPQIRRAS